MTLSGITNIIKLQLFSLFHFVFLVKQCCDHQLYLTFNSFGCLKYWLEHNLNKLVYLLALCNFIVFLISLLEQWWWWKINEWKYFCWWFCIGRTNCWSIGLYLCTSGMSAEPTFSLFNSSYFFWCIIYSRCLIIHIV